MSTGTVKVLFNHTAAFTSMVCFSYLSCKVTFVTSSKKVQEQHTFVGNNGHLGFKHCNVDNYANYAHFLIYAIITDCSPLALNIFDHTTFKQFHFSRQMYEIQQKCS